MTSIILALAGVSMGCVPPSFSERMRAEVRRLLEGATVHDGRIGFQFTVLSVSVGTLDESAPFDIIVGDGTETNIRMNVVEKGTKTPLLHATLSCSSPYLDMVDLRTRILAFSLGRPLPPLQDEEAQRKMGQAIAGQLVGRRPRQATSEKASPTLLPLPSPEPVHQPVPHIVKAVATGLSAEVNSNGARAPKPFDVKVGETFAPPKLRRVVTGGKESSVRRKDPPSLSGYSGAQHRAREDFMARLWRLAPSGTADLAHLKQVASETGRNSGRSTMHIKALRAAGFLEENYRTGKFILNPNKKPPGV